VAIEGVELSAHLGARDAHILGYHVRTGSAELLAALAVFRADREDRARRIVERLNDLGVPLSLDDVRRLAGRGVLARPHIAEALFEAGFVPNYNDAFRRYLGIGSPAYVPKKRFEPEQAIALIHAAGGVAVLAHPATEFVESDIVGLAGLGLDGVEVVHPRHTPEMTRDLERLAARIGLVTTGGSDFHGGGRGESRVGHPAISYDRVKELGRQS
jgi:predicted metal-dependent phosphoesterase TrpH